MLFGLILKCIFVSLQEKIQPLNNSIMKIKHLLIGMLAIAGAVACKQEEPVQEPKLDVDKEAVTLTATAGEATFNVTSNQDWTATADADWVSLEPASGAASEKAVAVKVTAEDNEATEARTATVTVKAGALTKTVALTQSGTEATPEPELPTPNVDWTSDKVVSYDLPESASSKRQLLKNIKYTFDENYLYVKLQASAAEFAAAPAEYLGIFVYDVTDGSGDGYYGWWNDAKGNVELEGEHIGTFNGKDITLTIGETPVEVVTEENGDELVWTMNILRSAHENLALENPYFAFLTYIGWEPNGALPDKYEDMLQLVPASVEPEPEPEIQWGMMGCFVDNLWATDVPMTKEGEWIVAKGAQFTELTFKIRGNASWDDATNIGVAPGSDRGVVNGKVAVVTAEYAKANLGGDAADIKLNGEAGTYDVYFSFENLEVYVMEQGYKPGEKEPQNPDPVEITYTVVGTLNNINWNNSAPEGLMTFDGQYHVAKNVPFVTAATLYGGADQIEFKIVETGTWSGYGRVEDVVNPINTEIAVKLSGDNIMVSGAEGNYDVYFDKENAKVWVMESGLKPGETPAEPEPEYTLDGKQWMAEVEGMQVLFDFGLAEEGMLSVGMPSMDGTGFGLYMAGLYEIVPTNGTSGVVNFTQYDWEWDEFADPVEIPYSELTATTVKAVSEGVFGTTEPISFTLVENPYEIAPPQTGGDGPSGAIENGEYWFFNGEKVMAPLAEGETTGVLPAGNVISGASTEKNIFTLTYDPDWTYYTIQDSYGRYLGQTDETGNITVTDVLPTDDTYAFYLWAVEPGYGEATSIYNAAYYYDITYSAADNNWVLVDGGYEYPETLPVLVKAENPVEEPVVPEGPKVVTAAEFNAATDNSIEYQVSGTISGIYQAYSSSYNNISLYISDETGEILAYRLSCEGISDPANTLTKGDLITVKGKRTLYNEKPQMAQGGVIVSHTDVVDETPTGGATLSFADKANRTVFTTSQQVWEQNGVKLINDKASSTNNVADYAAPVRFYQGSKLTVEYAGMTKIEFTCNNGSYATELKNSIKTGTVTLSGSVVTVVLDSAADSFVVASLAKQVRMDSLTVYAE